MFVLWINLLVGLLSQRLIHLALVLNHYLFLLRDILRTLAFYLLYHV